VYAVVQYCSSLVFVCGRRDCLTNLFTGYVLASASTSEALLRKEKGILPSPLRGFPDRGYPGPRAGQGPAARG